MFPRKNLLEVCLLELAADSYPLPPSCRGRVATHNCVSTGPAACGRLDNATNTGMYRSPFSTSPSSPLLLLSPCPIIVGGDERRVSSVEQPCHDIDEMIDWLGTSGGSRGTRQLVGKISARPWPLLYGSPCHRYVVSSGRIRVKDLVAVR